MELSEARHVAEFIAEAFRTTCSKVVVAGSIRRGKPEVKDIEIVVLPLPTEEEDIFGEPLPNGKTPLEYLLRGMERTQILSKDPDNVKDGQWYKRFIVTDKKIALDLFIAKPDGDNFGNLLAIRTGSWEFSKWFMTSRQFRGGMPHDLRQHDGYLWRGLNKVPCPAEESFFAALELPCLPPEERGLDGIEKLRRL